MIFQMRTEVHFNLAMALQAHWTRIRRLTLTNLMCQSVISIFDYLKYPRTITHVCISKAVFVSTSAVVGALADLQPTLVEMKLVDVYRTTIFAERIRLGDLERAWAVVKEGNPNGAMRSLEWTDVAGKVRCLVQRQLLDGGDRGEDMECIS